MAMTECSECGKPISDEARRCPHCGAKARRKAGLGAYLVAVLALVFVVRAAVHEPETSEHMAGEQAQDEAANKRAQLALGFLAGLKKRLRDPDSLDVISLRVSEKADLICAEYRARNGFGGFGVERMVVNSFGTSQRADAWKQHCTGTLHDHTNVKHLL